MAVDVKSELPVAMIVVSANENEKKHSVSLFWKASEYVKPKKLLADPQCSASNLREIALENVLCWLFLTRRIKAWEFEAFSELTGNSEVMGQKTSKWLIGSELR